MTDIIVGDWIRFYRGDKMVIAVVQYIGKQQYYPWGDEARTDICRVAFKDILEVRTICSTNL